MINNYFVNNPTVFWIIYGGIHAAVVVMLTYWCYLTKRTMAAGR